MCQNDNSDTQKDAGFPFGFPVNPKMANPTKCCVCCTIFLFISAFPFNPKTGILQDNKQSQRSRRGRIALRLRPPGAPRSGCWRCRSLSAPSASSLKPFEPKNSAERPGVNKQTHCRTSAYVTFRRFDGKAFWTPERSKMLRSH